MSVKTKARLSMIGLLFIKLLGIAAYIGGIIVIINYLANLVGNSRPDDFTKSLLVALGLIVLGILMQFLFKYVYKKVLVVKLLQVEFPGCFYSWTAGFDENTINCEVNLVEPGNRYKSEDMLTGNYKGVNFRQADVNIKNVVQEKSTFGDDDTVTKVYKYFSGRMIIMDSPVKVKLPVYFYSYEFENRFIKRAQLSIETAVTSDKEFSDIFDVFKMKGGTARPVLTPEIKKALMVTYKKYPNMAAKFSGDKICIAINTKESTFDWSASRGFIYRKEIEANRNQAQVIKDIIDIIKSEEKND